MIVRYVRNELNKTNKLVFRLSARLWLIEQLLLPVERRKCFECRGLAMGGAAACSACDNSGRFMRWFSNSVREGIIPLDERDLVKEPTIPEARSKAYTHALKRLNQDLGRAIKESYVAHVAREADPQD